MKSNKTTYCVPHPDKGSRNIPQGFHQIVCTFQHGRSTAEPPVLLNSRFRSASGPRFGNAPSASVRTKPCRNGRNGTAAGSNLGPFGVRVLALATLWIPKEQEGCHQTCAYH